MMVMGISGHSPFVHFSFTEAVITKYTLISFLAACSVGTAHWNYPVLVTQGQPSCESTIIMDNRP